MPKSEEKWFEDFDGWLTSPSGESRRMTVESRRSVEAFVKTAPTCSALKHLESSIGNDEFMFDLLYNDNIEAARAAKKRELKCGN
jgi:hypothetical protein